MSILLSLVSKLYYKLWSFNVSDEDYLFPLYDGTGASQPLLTGLLLRTFFLVVLTLYQWLFVCGENTKFYVSH